MTGNIVWWRQIEDVEMQTIIVMINKIVTVDKHIPLVQKLLKCQITHLKILWHLFIGILLYFFSFKNCHLFCHCVNVTYVLLLGNILC